MSEITEAMNMLEDLPESAQDGQQEADEAAATTLQEEATETTQEATESGSKASLPCHRYAVDMLSMVELGRQGEGKARRIEIGVSSWLATLPGAHLEIVAVRPGETESYLPEGVTLEGNVLCWMPTRDDTAKDGYGRGEVRATLGDSCYKSPVFRTRIEAALEDAAAAPMMQATEAELVALNVTTDEAAPTPTDEDKGEIYHVEGLDVVKLGRQGENLTQEVKIDVSAWAEDNMAGATFLIAAVRPGENESYLPEITQSGNILTWKPTAADTAKGGYGRAEVQAVKGALIRKSPVFRTRIEAALESSGSTPTEPPAWAQQILGSVSAAQKAAANAQQAAQTAQQQATAADSSAQEAAASVSGLRGWSLTEETDGTVTIDHAAAQSTAETTN